MREKSKYTLREWRSLRMMSRRKLAEITGLSERTIINYESDINLLRSASFDNIESIAKALDIVIDDIFLG